MITTRVYATTSLHFSNKVVGQAINQMERSNRKGLSLILRSFNLVVSATTSMFGKFKCYTSPTFTTLKFKRIIFVLRLNFCQTCAAKIFPPLSSANHLESSQSRGKFLSCFVYKTIWKVLTMTSRRLRALNFYVSTNYVLMASLKLISKILVPLAELQLFKAL